jgi:RNA polymerase sigma factor (TIGR02999 family)
MGDITALLKRAAANDPAAWDEVFGLLYDDVHRMARARLAGNQAMTLLDTTGLAHETYLRFRNAERIDVASRAQLMAYVSQVLRAVIVDFARKRAAERRGGGRIRVTLDTDLADSIAGADADVAHVADALQALEASDPRLRRVVEMRFFAGMTDAEIGEVLGLTPRTVGRDWQRARPPADTHECALLADCRRKGPSAVRSAAANGSFQTTLLEATRPAGRGLAGLHDPRLHQDRIPCRRHCRRFQPCLVARPRSDVVEIRDGPEDPRRVGERQSGDAAVRAKKPAWRRRARCVARKPPAPLGEGGRLRASGG